MRVLKEICRQPAALFGLFVVVAVVVLALAAPLIAPYDPDNQMFRRADARRARRCRPARSFLLGTDTLGRDLFSRLLYGARTSLVIGLVANGVAVCIGLLVGVIAGYLRGLAGNLLMRSPT